MQPTDNVKSKNTNIVLLGFAGTGKTVIGRSLAAMLDFDFAETDECLKSVTGLLPAQILKKYGMRRFLSEEALVLKKLAAEESLVIAAGCPVISVEQLGILAGSAVFWLTASEDLLYKRFCRRPLGSSKKTDQESFREIFYAQERIYESLSMAKIKTDDFEINEAARHLKEVYLQLLPRLENVSHN